VSKKIILGFVVAFLLAGVENSIAQEKNDAAGEKQTQEQRRDVSSGQRGMRPGRGAERFMRSGFGDWLDELTRAYEDNNREKIGQLIENMKTLRRGMMNVPPEDGRVLRLLTEALGAKRVVEIGTSNGYSGIWFCLALQTTGGKLITYEIDRERAALARKNFKRAGVDKIVTLVEGDAHEEIKKLKGPIDILFIDADKEGYIDYLNKLAPLVRPGGLILAHNMNRPAPDTKYIKAITTNPDLETIFLHMDAAGIGVTLKKR